LSSLVVGHTAVTTRRRHGTATIRKRGTKWRAQVRRQGHPAVTRSFLLKADAEAWARQKEAELEQGELPVDRGALRSLTLGALLERYEAEVSPTKKGCESEGYRLRAMRARSIAGTTLDKLTTARIALFRDERLAIKRPARTRHLAALFGGGTERLGHPSAA
jgi:hypothetical protein